MTARQRMTHCCGTSPPSLGVNRRQMVELPPANLKRWTPRRKAAIVTAVLNCQLTSEEACHRYQLSKEEFVAWQNAFETYGYSGLFSTQLQQYRISR